MAEQEDILRRVRKLSERAGHPNTPAEEAESAAAMAHSLMLKYAIEWSMVHTEPEERARVTKKDFVYAEISRHAKPKLQLLTEITHANRCRLVWYPNQRRQQDCILVGFPEDIEFVELLYTSLLMQMVRSAKRAVEENFVGQSQGRFNFRSNYMTGYALRIGSRLRRINTEEVEPGSGRELALRTREDDVKDAYGMFFPNLGKSKSLVNKNTNADAMFVGMRDADMADISGGRNTLHHDRKELA